jgi:hypothetical protein
MLLEVESLEKISFTFTESAVPHSDKGKLRITGFQTQWLMANLSLDNSLGQDGSGASTADRFGACSS